MPAPIFEEHKDLKAVIAELASYADATEHDDDYFDSEPSEAEAWVKEARKVYDQAILQQQAFRDTWATADKMRGVTTEYVAALEARLAALEKKVFSLQMTHILELPAGYLAPEDFPESAADGTSE